METTKEKVSYCIGLKTGIDLSRQFTDIDTDCLNQGILDGLINNEFQLPKEEIQSILGSLRQQMEMQQKDFAAKMAESNKKSSEAFLAQNKEKENVTTLSTGLQYRIIHSGEMTSSRPTLFDAVTIHYRGSFIDGRVFDSSYQRGNPVVLPLNRVIPGWSEILQLMHVGDKWEVFIPSYLAYGENGMAPAIGPNMALIFEMELIGINDKE